MGGAEKKTLIFTKCLLLIAHSSRHVAVILLVCLASQDADDIPVILHRKKQILQ